MLISCAENKKPIDLVNVFNGTGYSGHTYPGATTPFGQVQLSPDTKPTPHSAGDHPAGYHWEDNELLGFSHNHLSGTGCPDLGDFLFTPVLGDSVKTLTLLHENEKAQPGYYKIDCPEGITAELTATPRVGVHRYTFNGKGARRIMVDALYFVGDWGRISNPVLRTTGEQTIEGSRTEDGWARKRDVYMSAVFSVPFSEVKDCGEGKLLLTFPEDTKTVTACVAISGTSIEGAQANLKTEAPEPDFDAILAATTKTWQEALGTITVEGGPEALFYTNLYHTYLTPNAIDDADGTYRDLQGNNKKLKPGQHFYSTLSIWDTFRTWNPLQTLLDHNLVNDMINSMLDMYDCRGELPIWPLASSETGCMIGYHSASIIADAWLQGIRGFDGEKALNAMIKSSDCNNQTASLLYNQYDYIPIDKDMDESVSQTLEFAYDDWCIARMAEDLGHQDIAERYYQRAQRYRNLFDPSTRFMRGKTDDGKWRTPFDVLSASRDFTEATPWQYRFFVPHDIAGLTALMGGKQPMAAALDSLFTFKPEHQDSVHVGIGGLIGQYAHGNEPCHNMAWLPYWVENPALSQKFIRQILDETYSIAPDGLCGNDDCGQMGAWYVLAAIGLSPVCPGTGQYLFSAPLFKKTTMRLANGKTLTIKADHPEWAYIDEVTFNGNAVDQHYLTYQQIMQGGELSFKLSEQPSHKRDNLPSPYSMTTK